MSQHEASTESEAEFFDSLAITVSSDPEAQTGFSFHSKTSVLVCEVEMFDEPDPDGFVAKAQAFKNGTFEHERMLLPGDVYALSHHYTIEGSKIVKNNSIFPIELNYCGETYYLKVTKNNKLILTK